MNKDQNPRFSVYIHFPFCVSKCLYCDFYSITKTDRIKPYIYALEREIRDWTRRNGTLEPVSIYIGGGTPSLMRKDEWKLLGSCIESYFRIQDSCEYTIECNPDTYSLEKARLWAEYGINRLSIGIQSLNPEVLRAIGRPHTQSDVYEMLSDMESKGVFRNISADLMYGLPNETEENLMDSAKTLIRGYPSITHFSVYELDIKESTPISKLRGSTVMPMEKDVFKRGQTLFKYLAKHGFQRYEVSNFAKPGFRSIHNTGYWRFRPYIGFGASACSFNSTERWKNLSNTDLYIKNSGTHKTIREYTETLTREMAEIELLFTGLRTSSGIILEDYRRLSGKELVSGQRARFIQEMIREGYGILESNSFRLTERGMDMADSITSKLISL